jgi:hypothetical protein
VLTLSDNKRDHRAQINRSESQRIKAGASLGIFVLIFLFNPASLVTPTPNPQPPSTKENDAAIAATPAVLPSQGAKDTTKQTVEPDAPHKKPIYTANVKAIATPPPTQNAKPNL